MMIIDHFNVSEAEQRPAEMMVKRCLKILGINSNKRFIKSTVSKLRNESQKKSLMGFVTISVYTFLIQSLRNFRRLKTETLIIYERI